jgi:hypothetical protein
MMPESELTAFCFACGEVLNAGGKGRASAQSNLPFVCSLHHHHLRCVTCSRLFDYYSYFYWYVYVYDYDYVHWENLKFM